jgi:hypothetical protein
VLPTSLPRYGVRVARRDGSQSRILLLSAPSEGDALAETSVPRVDTRGLPDDDVLAVI